MTSVVVEVPLFRSVSVIHYGSSANYEKFVGSYFEKKCADETNKENEAHKHVIIYAAYQPDYSYMDSDGVYGRCWAVCINNTETSEWSTYIIRNWVDLVKYYESFGYSFITN